jgi:hypothetical protein
MITYFCGFYDDYQTEYVKILLFASFLFVFKFLLEHSF